MVYLWNRNQKFKRGIDATIKPADKKAIIDLTNRFVS